MTAEQSQEMIAKQIFFLLLFAKLHEPEELSILWIKQRTLVILLSRFGCGCFLSDLSATAIQPHIRLGITLSCSNINNTKNDIRYISISISSHICNICIEGGVFSFPLLKWGMPKIIVLWLVSLLSFSIRLHSSPYHCFLSKLEDYWRCWCFPSKAFG